MFRLPWLIRKAAATGQNWEGDETADFYWIEENAESAFFSYSSLLKPSNKTFCCLKTGPVHTTNLNTFSDNGLHCVGWTITSNPICFLKYACSQITCILNTSTFPGENVSESWMSKWTSQKLELYVIWLHHTVTLHSLIRSMVIWLHGKIC